MLCYEQSGYVAAVHSVPLVDEVCLSETRLSKRFLVLALRSDRCEGAPTASLRDGRPARRWDAHSAGATALQVKTAPSATSAGSSSFRVESNADNGWSSSSPVGMWAGCI